MGINALEFFLAPCRCEACVDREWCLRDWDQFQRLYSTVAQVTGSYVQAMHISDPDVIEGLCEVKNSEMAAAPKSPRWWRFDDVMHRLTDIADQLIASRATGDKVKFYPRPVNVAAKERARRLEQMQDDFIERSRRANRERRQRANYGITE